MQAISKGDEVTISYTDLLQPSALRRGSLTERFCFNCDCPRCCEDGTGGTSSLGKRNGIGKQQYKHAPSRMAILRNVIASATLHVLIIKSCPADMAYQLVRRQCAGDSFLGVLSVGGSSVEASLASAVEHGTHLFLEQAS